MAWPLQCVTCLGSLEQVSAKNFATVCRRQLGRIRRACFVAQQGFNDSIGIPYLPAPYSRAAYPGFADHLGDGQSLVRQQHNSGTLDLLLRAAFGLRSTTRCTPTRTASKVRASTGTNHCAPFIARVAGRIPRSARVLAEPTQMPSCSAAFAKLTIGAPASSGLYSAKPRRSRISRTRTVVQVSPSPVRHRIRLSDTASSRSGQCPASSRSASTADGAMSPGYRPVFTLGTRTSVCALRANGSTRPPHWRCRPGRRRSPAPGCGSGVAWGLYWSTARSKPRADREQV